MSGLLLGVNRIGALPIALSAVTRSTRCKPRVVGVEGVPSRAVSLSSIHPGGAKTAQLVLSSRDRFQMRGVHTKGDAAQMIEFQAKWDSTECKCVGNTVGLQVVPIISDLPVAVPVPARHPKPAAPEIGAICRDRAISVDFGPESLGKGTLASHLATSIAGVMRATVRAVRPLSIVPRPLSADGALALGAGMTAI